MSRSTIYIYSKPDDGSGSEPTVIENPEEAEFPNSISPDGHYLVYACYAMTDPGPIYGNLGSSLMGGGKPFPIVQTPV